MATRSLHRLRPSRIKPSSQCLHHVYRPKSRLYSSNSDTAGWDSLETVDLAFDLHKEGTCKKDPSTCKNPIVFVHGFFGSKQNNRSMSKRLSADLNRPVYAIDLRNHGDSNHHQTHNYPALAADILNFLSQHNISSPTLIGHSMGAKACMALALWKPERVANLIAVDNAPVDAALKSDFHQYVQGMKEVERVGAKSQKEADGLLQPFVKVGEAWSGSWWPTELAVRQFLLTNLQRPSAKSESKEFKWRIPLQILARQLDAMGDFPIRNPETYRFARPTLMVRGTKSPYVADEALPVIGQFFPSFKLVDISAGHWVISENPEEFRRAVVDFLEEKE